MPLQPIVIDPLIDPSPEQAENMSAAVTQDYSHVLNHTEFQQWLAATVKVNFIARICDACIFFFDYPSDSSTRKATNFLLDP